MTRFRTPLSRPVFRKIGTAAIAGISLSFWGGDIAWPPSGEKPSLASIAFPKAMAWDGEDNRRGRWGRRPSRDRDDDNDGRRQREDDSPRSSSGRDDNDKRSFNSRGGDATSQGRERALSVDADRRTVGLSFKVGQAHRDHDRKEAPHGRHHDSAHWTFFHQGGEHDGKSISEAFVHHIQHDDTQNASTERVLDKAVSPVAKRYTEGTKPLSPSTTILAKTRFAIGALSYSPLEVLAVGLGPESVELAKALGFEADAPVGTDEIVRLTVPPGLNALRAQELLNHEFPGQQFELNKIYRIYRAQMRDEAGPSVESLPPDAKCTEERCFARSAIGWKDELGSCARAIKVGVIDTAFDLGHPVFAGRNIHPFDFLVDGRKAAPGWHGTGVLSLLAANSSSGAPGLIPEAEFFAASVFFSDEDGEMAADTISVLKALDWMKKNGVKIVNMSFAGPRDELVAQEIDRMSEAGVVFVAAAGNDGPTADPSYPAAYPQVIAVTAVTKDLRNYRYANRGPHIDVSAPGVNIWAAVPDRREGYHTGTSFAAPHVTALLAVEPRDSLKQDKAALLDRLPVRDLGTSGRDETYGRGLLLAPESCTQPPSDTVARDAVASAE